MGMCRSIKRLRKTDSASDEEIREAALQFVRKISGYRIPATKNEEAFEEAVVEVSLAPARLLERLPKLSSAASRGITTGRGVRPPRSSARLATPPAQTRAEDPA